MSVLEQGPQDPVDAAIRIGECFERRGIPYAVGGALAYGMWAIPRATLDVDINVFVEASELPRVFDALTELGLEVPRQQATSTAARLGMFALAWGRYRIDVFVPSIEYCWLAAKTRVLRAVDGHDVWFLSAEAIAVFKLLFFRPKDIVDLQRLLAVQGERFDRAHVRAHIVDMLGDDDPRVQKWDDLVREA